MYHHGNYLFTEITLQQKFNQVFLKIKNQGRISTFLLNLIIFTKTRFTQMNRVQLPHAYYGYVTISQMNYYLYYKSITPFLVFIYRPCKRNGSSDFGAIRQITTSEIPVCCACLQITFTLISEQPTNRSLSDLTEPKCRKTKH